ncbi:dCTP deaminase [Nonlabens xiamenensis]|uniref:dCTP deaminase n=1 Tax=Nonlabens xiamenensis TaxID=2341043 RepID=UPI0013DDA8F0|nr:dCTP deaminase [Nonlabens xiamenensis]
MNSNSKTGLLIKDEILDLLEKKELIIEPLLEIDQVGEITVDLRIGTDFLSLQQGRNAFIDTTTNNIKSRPIKSHYTQTRRKIGEYFLFHPNQPVLFSTLEYLKLPPNIYADLNLRSSFGRLGLGLSTIIQPGYCGCASVEITNRGNTPIRVLSGTRMVQIRFYKLDSNSEYFNKVRKYTCQVRPVPSKANEDSELVKLKSMKSK